MKKSTETAYLYADIECPYCGTDTEPHPVIWATAKAVEVECINCRELFEADHDG